MSQNPKSPAASAPAASAATSMTSAPAAATGAADPRLRPRRQRLGQLAPGDPGPRRDRRVIAPDMVGFGYTDRPAGIQSTAWDTWVAQARSPRRPRARAGRPRRQLLRRCPGHGLAIRAPERVQRLVLMGSVGVPSRSPKGSTPCGATSLVREHAPHHGLLRLGPRTRHRRARQAALRASIRPGSGVLLGDVPRTAPALGGRDDQRRGRHPRPAPRNPIIHGREDKVIPCPTR